MEEPQSPLSLPTLTNGNAEETEDEVYLVQAATNWLKGKDHRREEYEA